MADVTTYRHALVAFAWGGQLVAQGEVRPSTDPAVVGNPQFWDTVTDVDMTTDASVEPS